MVPGLTPANGLSRTFYLWDKLLRTTRRDGPEQVPCQVVVTFLCQTKNHSGWMNSTRTGLVLSSSK